MSLDMLSGMFDRTLVSRGRATDTEKTALRFTSSKIGKRCEAPTGLNCVPINDLNNDLLKVYGLIKNLLKHNLIKLNTF